jgi:Aldo/keto reductase family
VALAWLKSRPGLQSTIIGARTFKQPEANFKALDLILTPEQIASLDTVSRPVLNFPDFELDRLGNRGINARPCERANPPRTRASPDRWWCDFRRPA